MARTKKTVTKKPSLAALAPLMRAVAARARPAGAGAGRKIGIRGDVRWVLRDGDRVIRRGVRRNLVVDVGLNFMRNYGFDPATTFSQMQAIAIGSNGAAPAPGDTDIVAETGRVAATYAAGGTGVVVMSASFGPGVGTGTVAEAGMFDDTGAGPASGNMFDRFLIGPLTKAAGATLDVEITITFTAT